jgi:hypothetical protein
LYRMERLSPLRGLLGAGEVNHVCTWIHREWAAASHASAKAGYELMGLATEPILVRADEATIATSARTAGQPVPEEETAKPGLWKFVRSGDGYDIAGPSGERGHFRRLKGFMQIEKLLRQCGKPVPMLELVGNFGISPTRVASGESALDEDGEGFEELGRQSDEPMLDDEAKDNLKARLRSIAEELDKAVRAGDIVLADALNVEKSRIVMCLEKSTGLSGRDRQLNRAIDKWRSAIAKTLSRAYQQMREANPPLTLVADHLQGSISASGDSYIYNSLPGPLWSLD